MRRTRERIQQYYTGYQQQYSNGQQQYGNGQQQYGNSLQQYSNGQQYYTSGQKRYSIGRLNSDPPSRQDDGAEELVHRPKRTQVTYRVRNDQPEGRRLYKSEVIWYLLRFVTKNDEFCYESVLGYPVMVFLYIIAQIADLHVLGMAAHILYIIHWQNQIPHFRVTTYYIHFMLWSVTTIILNRLYIIIIGYLIYAFFSFKFETIRWVLVF